MKTAMQKINVALPANHYVLKYCLTRVIIKLLEKL
jgi:hypothetical protein